MGVAGCAGDGNGDQAEPADTPTGTGADTATPTAEPTPTETETETPTETPATGEPNVTITQEAEVGYDESGYGTDVYAAFELTNEGDAPSGIVVATADFFDADGNYIDDATDRIGSLNPGEVWNARIYPLAMDADRVDRAEVSGEYGLEPPTVPDGVELVSSEMLTGDNVKIRGEVKNGMDHQLDYIEFHGKVYNDAGEVIGGEWTNEAGIPAGATARFDFEWRGYERVSEAADHEVVLTTS